MRTKKGIVTSAKMQGTIVVTVHSYKMHSIYGKSYRTSKKYFADTAGLSFNEGDEVVISESRPLSKKKRWRVVEGAQ